MRAATTATIFDRFVAERVLNDQSCRGSVRLIQLNGPRDCREVAMLGRWPLDLPQRIVEMKVVFGLRMPRDLSVSETTDRLKAAGFQCFADLSVWKSLGAEQAVKQGARWLMSQHLRNAHDGPHFDGWCELCRAAVRFSISDAPQLPGVWFYRDDAVCSSCGMMARLRLGVLLLRQLLGDGRPAIYVNEQLSALYPWLLRHYADVVGSEYAPNPDTRPLLQQRLDWLLRDQRRELLVHEDATCLSHPDARFNALMSFDELEHIPDYHAALREFARVLKPGGIAVLTAPFLDGDETTRVRARHRADGSIEHLLPPDYHGDPMVAGNQILCYQDFGWDILAALRSAGFSEAHTVSYWNLSLGFPSLITAWVARR
ncbi:MAG TPA: methyltransferase domain-containing protein [Patescibacteria group bacterium]|nr:methyltransferase domain-containing protein [Patescibacteria group bacterium]